LTSSSHTAPPARTAAPRPAWGAAWVRTLPALVLLAACGGVHVKPEDHVPPPLVDEVPLRTGIYYSPEFRGYVHKEDRWSTKWDVQLGAAHVTKLDRLLHAMFPKLTPVADLAKPPQPPLDLILEPRFEEYSFVTPRDAGADYYAVTIKYRMNLYDGAAHLIDSLVYTGYGSVGGGGLSTEKPLKVATEKAMRDAGAKFATEFPDQSTVRKLVAGEKVEPVPTGTAAAAAGSAIEDVSPTSGPPASPPAAPKSAPAPAPSAGAPAAAPPPPASSPPANGPAAPTPAAPGAGSGAATPPGAAAPPASAPPSASPGATAEPPAPNPPPPTSAPPGPGTPPAAAPPPPR
jgi:hypothetical protein